MRHSAVRLALPAIALFAAIGLIAAGVSSRMAPPQAVIVTIDIEKVFDGIDERTSKQDELKIYGDGLKAEIDKLTKQMKDEDDKRGVLPEGPEKRAATARILEMQINARVKGELYNAMIDQQRAEMFRYLYGKITEATKRLATMNNYTLVIASDEKVPLPTGGQSADVQRVISLKRVLYSAPGHDATAELITLMNNEFKASGGKPGSLVPPAPPPAANSGKK